MKKVKVGVLGTGNIGTDLAVKIQRSPLLTCGAFIGRNPGSQGMIKAQSLGIPTSPQGIDFLVENPEACDIVFDATSAASHAVHAPILKELGILAIDLTPAKIGEMCIPAVNLEECTELANVNMVTCGGQASIPLAYSIGQTQSEIDYIEVVSSIASRSAGPATRVNLDEYIHTTEAAIRRFSGSSRCKAILNLNPAVPCINMQTTVLAKVANPDIEKLKSVLYPVVEKVRAYVPGYEVIVGPAVENGRIVVTVRVKGLGDYLPEYAGNLDIINCAAVAMAEQYARRIVVKGEKNSSASRTPTAQGREFL